ncbi:MAG: DNA topoisomerase (ATP-hydrolyzing) [Myxococcota bacterium]
MNYALSVIMSRALPDVRDGLKPVQRRILFCMHRDLHLSPDSRFAKCARIVGDVIGKFHPHGDQAVYSALVRMAQGWTMRVPLVEGQGNFGSQDGDPPAAYRYTEARLNKIAPELLSELGAKTVAFRPTFDGQRSEPIVLPARFPNLLVNGAHGIAVGMATSIPPHNLGEVCDGLVAMIDDPKITLARILQKIKGPDFPTGGEVTCTRAELKETYESGHGSIKLRGQWKLEAGKKGAKQIVLTSIPYGLERKDLATKIGDIIISKKLPPLVDVRDESTEDVRMVLEIRKDANPELIIAYLNKHTPLQGNVSYNFTCLIPTDNEEISRPERIGLVPMLRYFLDFRFEVVQRRLTHELNQVNERLHILEGFERIFDALDEIIKIIRRSNDKADAANKIMKRFDLDELQTDAILELKLYRLAKLQILVVQKEAEEKRKAQKRLQALLRSPKKMWGLVRTEIQDIKTQFADKRRTRILTQDEEPEFSETDFIIDEDATVIVSARGWIKRQQTVRDLSSTRIKDGDRVLACQAGSTRASIGFFSSKGHCYVSRIAEVPASTGYGDPVQKLFKFDDKEALVGVASFDPRSIALAEDEEVYEDGTPTPPYGVAVTKMGYAMRFSLWPHREPSNRSGRKFCRLKADDAVVSVFIQHEEEEEGYVIAVTDDGHAIAVALEEIPVLAGPGRGNMLIKVAESAEVLTAALVPKKRTGSVVVRTDKGKKYELFADGLLANRGGRGKAVVKRARFATVDHPVLEVPELSEE